MRNFLTIILIAMVAVGGWLAWALLLPVNPSGQKFVILHSGYSTHRIANELRAAGVIRSSHAFLFWHYLHPRHSLKAGEYLFEKPATAGEVHDRLARGDIYVHVLVIPEGFNIYDIAQAIQDAGLGSRAEFMKVATSATSMISDIAPEATSLEGYLFPNTYEFTRAQTTEDMVGAMVKQFRQVAREIGLTQQVQTTVTMASIIERETAVPEERPLVASVYYNRLAHRIPLQADPTVIYAEILKGDYGGSLHHDDMQFNSPYNTYTHAGLPPGPIGNPGKTSLLAAMHPAQTDYFYFVSDGNGHHRFSRSLEEHNRNVAAVRRIAAHR